MCVIITGIVQILRAYNQISRRRLVAVLLESVVGGCATGLLMIKVVDALGYSSWAGLAAGVVGLGGVGGVVLADRGCRRWLRRR